MHRYKKVGANSNHLMCAESRYFKLKPCCIALAAIFAQQVYANTSIEKAALNNQPTQKPVAQLQNYSDGDKDAKNIAEIAGTVQTIEKQQIEQQATAGRKLPIYWLSWFHHLG